MDKKSMVIAAVVGAGLMGLLALGMGAGPGRDDDRGCCGGGDTARFRMVVVENKYVVVLDTASGQVKYKDVSSGTSAGNF